MKIRNGFVSNSSSSSFVIYGVHLSDEYRSKIYNTYDDFLEINHIPYVSNYDDVYLGRSWSEVKDDETGKQFKERVEKEIKEALKDFELNLEFNTHTASEY
jgi:hypothetical protein